MEPKDFITIVLSIIAIVISLRALYISNKARNDNAKWQQTDIDLRINEKIRAIENPYVDFAINMKYKIEPIFNDFSSLALEIISNIPNNFEGKAEQKKYENIEIRHYFLNTIEKAAKKLEHDISCQNPTYLFVNVIAEIQKLDYNLDLKDSQKDT